MHLLFQLFFQEPGLVPLQQHSRSRSHGVVLAFADGGLLGEAHVAVRSYISPDAGIASICSLSRRSPVPDGLGTR